MLRHFYLMTSLRINLILSAMVAIVAEAIIIQHIKPGCLISLSTLVLNSRDWSEIVWLPEISRFKINLAIGFIRKKPAGMHWLGYNDATSSLNEAKT